MHEDFGKVVNQLMDTYSPQEILLLTMSFFSSLTFFYFAFLSAKFCLYLRAGIMCFSGLMTFFLVFMVCDACQILINQAIFYEAYNFDEIIFTFFIDAPD